ncbi:hypothetical protein STENOSP10_29990 [Stenotrophomonas sepilia]|uniref:Transmembrane protein n=1 Tax=Stenotrophomonas sepilia TaxID=2860290 RepID=A0ABQ6QG45_9GAMM|nr:hypothetical protein STENOSP10_29990 [Stenotrophomonas sepilia]
MAVVTSMSAINRRHVLNLYQGGSMKGTKESSAIVAKRNLVTVRVLAAVGIIVSVGFLLLMGLSLMGYIGGPIGLTPVMLTFLQVGEQGLDPSVGHGVGLKSIPLAHHAAALSWLFVGAIAVWAFKVLARFAAK